MNKFIEIFNVREEIETFKNLFSYSELSLITWYKENSLVSYFALTNNASIMEYFLYENDDENFFTILVELQFI